MTSQRRIVSRHRGYGRRSQVGLDHGLVGKLLASDPTPRTQREDNVLHRSAAAAVHSFALGLFNALVLLELQMELVLRAQLKTCLVSQNYIIVIGRIRTS
jgi:hypothetical protein